MTELRSLTGNRPRRIIANLKKRVFPPGLAQIRKEISDQADEFVDREDRIRVILASILNHADHVSLDKVIEMCVGLVEEEIESEVRYAEESYKWWQQVKIFGVECNRGRYYVEYGYRDFEDHWKSKWQEVPVFDEEMSEECC